MRSYCTIWAGWLILLLTATAGSDYVHSRMICPAQVGQTRGTLVIRIYNYRAQQTAPEAFSLVANGCAVHDWRQLLTLQGKSRSLARSFTMMV